MFNAFSQPYKMIRMSMSNNPQRPVSIKSITSYTIA
jgi:hypothetical protein